MPCELNVDEVTLVVTTLFAEDIDGSVEKFGTYETIIVELIGESDTPKVGKKRKRSISEGGNKEQGEGFDNLHKPRKGKENIFL